MRMRTCGESASGTSRARVPQLSVTYVSHVLPRWQARLPTDTTQRERSQLTQELPISTISPLVIISHALGTHGRRQPAAVDLQHTGA